MASYHTPVLLDEIAQLAQGHHRIVDCTVGGGGHAERVLANGAALLAIDRDPTALAAAQQRIGKDAAQWLQLDFCDPRALAAVSRFQPDFILLDLGVSGHQLDESERGFSFRPGTVLDMRMTPGVGPTAAQLLRDLDQRQLDHIFRVFGDESRSRRVAAAIVRRRRLSEFTTSDDLVNAIRAALGPRTGPADFARLFQAVRIAVNDELGALERALPALLDSLSGGGSLAVISYHSGEDRIVKHQFREWGRDCVCPPGAPVCRCRGVSLGRVEQRKPIRPAAAELASNPRARSARLRVFHKSDES